MNPHHADYTQGEATLVIGVGNPHRRDDGAGIHVARQLVSAAPAHVIVKEASGEGACLMAMWENVDRVILVDAVRSGSDAGRIHRLDASRNRIPSDFFHYSTHAFSVAEAVEMSRVLKTLPQCTILYGIEGLDFSAGVGLSPSVEKSTGKVAQEILQILESPASYRQQQEIQKKLEKGGTTCTNSHS